MSASGNWLVGFAIVAVAALAPLRSEASGYGWYVSSFNWSDYQKAQPLIEAKAVELAKADPYKNPIEVHRDTALFHVLDSRLRQKSPVPLIDESPLEEEFYWAEALRYAGEHQTKIGVGTLFTLFEKGRPLWKWPGCCTCGGYACLGAYVILSPDEAKAFYLEVSALNAKTRHPEDYRSYLLHLEQVLKKTSATGRALFFEGHD